MDDFAVRRLKCLGVDGNEYIVIIKTVGSGDDAKEIITTDDGREVLFVCEGVYRIKDAFIDLVCGELER